MRSPGVRAVEPGTGLRNDRREAEILWLRVLEQANLPPVEVAALVRRGDPGVRHDLKRRLFGRPDVTENLPIRTGP